MKNEHGTKAWLIAIAFLLLLALLSKEFLGVLIGIGFVSLLGFAIYKFIGGNGGFIR